MKRLLLSAAFAMSVLAVSAQTGSQPAKSSKDYLSSVSTSDDIRQLANRMQLNEAQYIRLRDLSRAKNEQLREINNMYANDAATRQQKLQAANQDFEKQLAQAVSQSQFTAYLESQGRVPESGTGANYQAAGYGGRSLEAGTATGTSTNGGAVNNNETNTTNNPDNVAVGSENKDKKMDKSKKENRRGKMKAEKVKKNKDQ